MDTGRTARAEPRAKSWEAKQANLLLWKSTKSVQGEGADPETVPEHDTVWAVLRL